ncbi:MAG: tetratricopeptide repeat protein [Nitriliruptorales bacterium]|nr:tetratricopeptide repeat protein [Nitriliruptorales bacterium]
MPTINCRFLGAVDVTVDGAPLDVDTRKAVALLAVLVVERSVTRDRAAAMLWSESAEDRAKASLRRTLSSLTTALGSGLHADRQRIALVDGAVRADVDVVLAGKADPERLVGLRRGPFLEDLTVRGAEGFEAWRRDAGMALDRDILRGLDVGIDEALHGPDTDRLETLAAERLAIEPAHERTHALRIWLAGLRGDRELVVARYRECVAALQGELGLAPQARTTSLYEEALEAGRLGSESPGPPSGHGAGAGIEAVRSVLALNGRFLPADVVGVAAAFSTDELAAAVDELAAAGTITTRGDTIGIPSAAVRAGIAEGLGAVRRQALHRRIADALAGRPGWAAVRASHLAGAGRHDEAAAAWCDAWVEEAGRGAWEQARHHLEEAIAAGHPDRTRLSLELADLDARRGRFDEARDTLVIALAAAPEAERGQVELRLGRLQLRRQRWAAAEVHLNAARSAGEISAPELALATWHQGDADAAVELAEQGLIRATKRGDVERTIAARNVLGVLLRRRGDARAAAEQLEAGLQLAAGGSAQRCALLNNLGLAWLDAGLHEQAEKRLEEALQTARAAGDLPAEGAILNSLADVARARGDKARAQELVRESVTRLSLVGADPITEPETWTLLDW